VSDGRTYYWKKDAAWYRREYVADLAIMHGPLALSALDWLCCHAKELNDAGRVKSGYSAIALGIGAQGEVEAVREAMLYAAEVGALDDFDEVGGKRFTARISGWEADQAQADRAEQNRRAYLARKAKDSAGSQQAVSADSAQREREREKDVGTDVPPSSSAVREQSAEIAGLCQSLAADMRSNDPKAKTPDESSAWRSAMRKLIDIDGRDANEVASVIHWCQRDSFWQSNILSPGKLREKYPTLLLRMNEPPARGKRPLDAPRGGDPTQPTPEQARALERLEAKHAAQALAAEKTADSPTSNPESEAT
jgi:ketosteroid isomerase-like protein